jgi:hypothetical protein
MFQKFATAEITGVKSAPERLGRSASLSKFADYDDFRTDDGYIYVRVRAISSRVNKNHDGWPSEELAKSYKTFLGKPNFVDHNNHDPERMRGVVVDAQLHVDDDKTSALDPYYATAPKEHTPPTWIELLIETDAKAFPKLAKAIVNGDIDGVSMGCNVERSKCSHCGNWATNPDEYCQHIRNKGAEFDYHRDGQKIAKKSYEDCYDIGFFEISYVFDPADETALFLEKPRTASFEKTACDCGCGEGACGDPDGCKCGPDCPSCKKDHKASVKESFGGDIAQQAAYAAGILGLAFSPYGLTMFADWLNDKPRDPSDPAHSQFGQEQVTEQEVKQFAQEHPEALENKGAQGLSTDEERAQGFDGGWMGKTAEYKYVKQQGDKWVITQKGTGKVLSEHDSEEKAKSAFRAMEMSMHGGSYMGAKIAAALGVTADTNQVPQSEMTVAPEKVDTLRQEEVCPICGSMMEDGICEVCNFEEPPEGFGNPDLTKAQDTDDMQQQQGLEAEDAQQDSMQVQQAQDQGQGMPQQPGSPQQPGMPMAASFSGRYNLLSPDAVSSDRTAADLSGGRVNTKEKPLLPGTRQTTDKPVGQKTISDSKKAVESSNTGEPMTDNTKTADSNAAEEVTALGERVSPEAVGGVDGNENPEGHKTVSVDGVGAVDNDENPPRHKQVDLEGGLLEEVGPHTDTWNGNEGDSAGQASPVSSGGDHTLGSKKIEILAADTVEGDLATSGGKVVDLDGGLKEEVGGPTSTFGDDSFHTTDPVTGEGYPAEGEVTSDGGVNPAGDPFPSTEEGVKAARTAYRTHMIAAMRLAETEIALGITSEDEKYDRIAELESESPESLEARLDTVAKVRTAGLAKKVVAAKRPTPSFQTTAALRSEPEEQDVDAEAIFS